MLTLKKNHFTAFSSFIRADHVICVNSIVMYEPAGGRVQCWGTYVIPRSDIDAELLHFYSNGMPSVLTALHHFPISLAKCSAWTGGTAGVGCSFLLNMKDTGTLCSQQDDTRCKWITLTCICSHASVVSVLSGTGAQAGSARYRPSAERNLIVTKQITCKQIKEPVSILFRFTNTLRILLK